MGAAEPEPWAKHELPEAASVQVGVSADELISTQGIQAIARTTLSSTGQGGSPHSPPVVKKLSRAPRSPEKFKLMTQAPA